MEQMEKKIRTIIDTAGHVKTEAVGFVGGACAAPLAKFSSAFGGVQTSTDKPEFAMLEQEETQRMSL